MTEIGMVGHVATGNTGVHHFVEASVDDYRRDHFYLYVYITDSYPATLSLTSLVPDQRV